MERMFVYFLSMHPVKVPVDKIQSFILDSPLRFIVLQIGM